jgi:hypothetical protein
VFLHPESWIQLNLRDDKSPIYLQRESELMQKDLSTSMVLDAMRNFLFQLDEVVNLEADAIHIEDPDPGRMSQSPGRSTPLPGQEVHRISSTIGGTIWSWRLGYHGRI